MVFCHRQHLRFIWGLHWNKISLFISICVRTWKFLLLFLEGNISLQNAFWPGDLQEHIGKANTVRSSGYPDTRVSILQLRKLQSVTSPEFLRDVLTIWVTSSLCSSISLHIRKVPKITALIYKYFIWETDSGNSLFVWRIAWRHKEAASISLLQQILKSYCNLLLSIV